MHRCSAEELAGFKHLRRLLLALSPFIKWDKLLFGFIKNFDCIGRMDFPDRPPYRITSSARPATRSGFVTAVKEKLAGNSHANAFDRQRIRDMRRGAGVGIKSLPNGGPEMRNDLGG